MPLLGTLIKQGLKLSSRVRLRTHTPAYYQDKELQKLLLEAELTAFGKHYNFSGILHSENVLNAFRENVPLFDYDKIFTQWWHRCLKQEKDVCWPGVIKYFALSSGTAGSSSKHIPVSREMIRALRKASIRQITTLGKYNLPASVFEKGILWLGGSTDLKKHGGYFEGDVSGISAKRVPIWFQHYYKPGKKISKEKDWSIKLDEITRQAEDWDIGIITGVPAWVQLLIEKVIAHYKLSNIHEIWPNLRVYAHGGVSFKPYKNTFEKFFTKKVHYVEMYPASEGFIAFQSEPNADSMKLITDNGIFYEFIPFNEDNFDSSGELKHAAQTLFIDEVSEDTDYALVMSTCAGAWRYIIGDVIRFTDKANANIVIRGRTKHFLSLTGEHLSVDNMNKAIDFVSGKLKVEIPEFTVCGIPYDGTFAHDWYIGTRTNVDTTVIKKMIDEKLCEINDDYSVERKSALKNIFVHAVPVTKFYEYLNSKGKMGGQNKFPRVLNTDQYVDWKSFLNE